MSARAGVAARGAGRAPAARQSAQSRRNPPWAHRRWGLHAAQRSLRAPCSQLGRAKHRRHWALIAPHGHIAAVLHGVQFTFALPCTQALPSSAAHRLQCRLRARCLHTPLPPHSTQSYGWRACGHSFLALFVCGVLAAPRGHAGAALHGAQVALALPCTQAVPPSTAHTLQCRLRAKCLQIPLPPHSTHSYGWRACGHCCLGRAGLGRGGADMARGRHRGARVAGGCARGPI